MKKKDWDKERIQEPYEEELEEPDDLDYEELDFEEEEREVWQEEEPEDEEDTLSPWMKIALFVGLMVLAAIICGALWYFTHPDKEEGDGQSVPVEESSEESVPEQPSDSSDTSAPESSSDQPGEPEPELPSDQSVAPEQDVPSSGEQASNAASEGNGESSAGNDSQISTDSGTLEISDAEIKEPVQGNDTMVFQAVQDSVTPKDVVNLRSVPTTLDEGNIVVQVQNGEALTRVGFNKDTGWSKLEYNGQTVYAVSQYLTTDLNYKTPVKPSDPNRVSTISGRVIIFANCDDWISPKEYVNLRTEPSTSEGDTTVSCQLNQGEKAHRTGYSADSGWSRVEYNGQVLYVVTSLVVTVTQEE